MGRVIAGIPVQVTKKRIKNMYLRISPQGQVRLSAPWGTPQSLIESFVASKADWIEQKRQRLLSMPEKKPRLYESGESIYLWGERYTLCVSPGRYGMRLADGKALFTVREGSTPAQRQAWIRKWYRQELKRAITPRLELWQEKTGLSCCGWQSKYMTSRWGTCNTGTKKIWLNLRLAQKSPQCLDYVILHELAHTAVADHGPRFKAILDSYMPQWRQVRAVLKADSGEEYTPI